jgi:hypothetical protein
MSPPDRARKLSSLRRPPASASTPGGGPVAGFLFNATAHTTTADLVSSELPDNISAMLPA